MSLLDRGRHDHVFPHENANDWPVSVFYAGRQANLLAQFPELLVPWTAA